MISYGDIRQPAQSRPKQLTEQLPTANRVRDRHAAILDADPREIINANLEIQALEDLAAERGEWP